MSRKLFHNEGVYLANWLQNDGVLFDAEFEEIRDRVVQSHQEVYAELVKQVKLQIRQQKERRRHTPKHRSDMKREQDTAIWALEDVLKRFEKVLGPEVGP